MPVQSGRAIGGIPTLTLAAHASEQAGVTP